MNAVRQRPERLDYLDGLRGLAVTLVVLFHTWMFSGCALPYWWNPLYNGFVGVNLFLVLSGFCLYWPFVNGRGYQPTLREFARRRARRILPPYYVALGLTVLCALALPHLGLSWAEGPQGIVPVLTAAAWHMALIHNLSVAQMKSLDGPFWSLGLELSFYVTLPLLVEAARRWGIGWTVAGAALATLAYRIAVYQYMGGRAGWEAMHHVWADTYFYVLPGRLFEFAAGMWGAALVAKGTARSSRLPFGLLCAACLCVGVWLDTVYGGFNPLSDSVFGLGFLCLLLQASRSTAFSVWRCRPLVRLGCLSYSIYLIHQPLLRLFTEMSFHHLHHWGLVFAAVIGVFLPALLGVAWLFHCAFERPFMNSHGEQTTSIARSRRRWLTTTRPQDELRAATG